MTLVGKTDLLSDLGERLIGPTNHGLGPLQSALDDVSLGADTN
jgi:hypothetical protein